VTVGSRGQAARDSIRSLVRLALPLALLGVLGVPAGATAATVRVGVPPLAEFPGIDEIPPLAYGYARPTVVFEADPGERNRLRVSKDDAASLTVHDPGAIIAVGDGCRAIDQHSAR